MVFVDLDLAKVQENAEKSVQLATNSSYRALAISADVTDPIQVREMICQTLNSFERIDYNVNCAGVLSQGAFYFDNLCANIVGRYR